MTVTALGVCALLWLMYFVYMLGPSSAAADSRATSDENSSSTVSFAVAKGEGMREIASALFEGGLIKSASLFKLYAIISGSAHKLKPGLYNVSGASSTPEIVRELVHGPAQEITVLIPEGQRLSEIDRELGQLGIIRAGELTRFSPARLADEYQFLVGVKTLEGYLFPDTYRFFVDSDPEAVAKTFLDNFVTKALPLLGANAAKYQGSLTIASLIEKEAPPSGDDRLIISGIIAKRLAMSMPLQIDASLAYVQFGGARYDTYKFYGLPPGPIANPGRDAIFAALHPKKSSYLYYLSDSKTHKIIFSTTFDEHDDNRGKYLRN